MNSSYSFFVEKVAWLVATKDFTVNQLPGLHTSKRKRAFFESNPCMLFAVRSHIGRSLLDVALGEGDKWSHQLLTLLLDSVKAPEVKGQPL